MPVLSTTRSSQGGSTKTEPFNLFGMSSDVREMIVSRMDAEILPNIRLTCKVLCKDSDIPFARERLAHRRFIFSEHSLQGLIDLTAHPVFGRYVRSVSFGTYRLERHMEELVTDMTLEDIQEGAETLARLRNHKQRADDQYDFVYSDGHIDMMTQAFRNLRKYKTEVTIGIYEDFLMYDGPCRNPRRQDLDRKGYGWDLAYGDFLLNSWARKTGATIICLNEALEQSGITRHTIEMDIGNTNHCSLQIGGRADWYVEDLVFINRVDYQLKANVCFKIRIVDQSYDHGDQTAIFRIDKDARRLEMTHHALKNHHEGVLPSGDLRRSSPSSGFPITDNLREVSLKHCHFTVTMLNVMLVKSLRKLEMSDMYLDESTGSADNAITFLTRLQDASHLEMLTLENMSDGFRAGVKDFFVTEKLAWKGQKEIQPGLLELTWMTTIKKTGRKDELRQLWLSLFGA